MHARTLEPSALSVCACRLQREVAEIRESVRLLKERLKSSELSLARLMKTKATLEHDILSLIHI